MCAVLKVYCWTRAWGLVLSSLGLAFKTGVRTATLIALCVAAPFAAYASGAAETSSVKISLGDLDLATPEGTRRAHQRLHAAARLACSRVEDSLDLGRQQHFVECVDAAMALALPQVAELVRKRSLAQSVAGN
jgi:UrcA family protein